MIQKSYLHKVYSKARTTINQYIFDGDFEGFDNTNFSDYWQSTGTPTVAQRARRDVYPENDTGYALQLDGSSSYLTLPRVGPTNNIFGDGQVLDLIFTDFMMSFWMYKTAWDTGDAEMIVYYGQVSQLFSLDLNISTAGKLTAKVSIASTLRSVNYDTSSISDGLHHIAFGSDGRYVRMYIDGVEVGTAYDHGSDVGTDKAGQLIYFGAKVVGTTVTNYTECIVDDITFYTSLLSATEVAQIYYTRNPISASAGFHFSLDSGLGSTDIADDGAYTLAINGVVSWVEGYTTRARSLLIRTSTGGSATQGIAQKTGTEVLITGGETYTGHAKVKATAGEQINLILTPTGGGSAQTVSIVATGDWQHIVNTYVTDASATLLSLSITLSSASASAKEFYIDRIALNDGDTAYDYFDATSSNTGGIVYDYDYDLLAHVATFTTYTFVGTWADVIEPGLSFEQEINTAGSQISVELARNTDDFGEGVDVDFGLEVRIFCIDDDNPNGVCKFVGRIIDYIPDNSAEKIVTLIESYGSELDSYTLETGDSSAAILPIYSTSKNSGNWASRFSQVVLPTRNIKLKKIRIKSTEAIYLDIYEGDPSLDVLSVTSGTPSFSVDSANTLIKDSIYTSRDDTTDPEDYTAELDEVVTLYAGRQYYIGTYQFGNSDLDLGGASSAEAGGILNYPPMGKLYHVLVINNSSFSPAYDTSFPGLYMELIEQDGSTTSEYNSYDPGAILRDAMQNYSNQGGSLQWDENSIQLTGTEVSYTFVSVSILDVLKKCLELAPAGWYFYIDQGENKLYFKPQSNTPDHKFVIGEHVKSVYPEKRTADMVNSIQFIGGDSGDGSNFYKEYADDNSIALYGQRLLKYVDNRVTIEATADTIAETLLATRAHPEVRATVEVTDATYDIEDVSVGDIVSFRNSGGNSDTKSKWDVGKWDEMYWDYNIKDLSTLEIQIARLSYSAEVITLTLSTVPPDVNKRIEDINRNLEAQQTINNPSNPTS